MSRSMLRLLLGMFVLVSTLAPAQEHKELGKMWTFEDLPLEFFKEAYGFVPSQEWLDHVRLSSLRFGNGCSASFVSAKGLILTNHHCARDRIARVSPKDQDWVQNGFMASTLEEEVRLPGLTVQQLVAMEDVTARMNEGVDGADSDQAAEQKREANRTAVQKEARTATPDLQVQIVALYQGGKYQLYRYKVWRDIRLVASPHLQCAKFGGDPDNFAYPRFGLDFTFVRAYEDDKPADTSKHFFAWNDAGPQEDDVVFVSGNPGSTGRLQTLAQMEFRRDVFYPLQLVQVHDSLDELRARSAQSSELEKELRTQILSFENQRKALQGYFDGLSNPKVLKTKAQAEARLRARVLGDPALRENFGDAWKKVEEICKEKRELFPRSRFYSDLGSPLIFRAILIIQATDPKNRRASRAAVRAKDSVSADLPPQLARNFQQALRLLGEEDPVMKALLGGKDPAEAAKDLAARTEVDDDAMVARLLEGGNEAVEASEDPVLVAARLINRSREQVRARLSELAQEENAQAHRIGQALFLAYGTSVSPDATFTLRLSDGVVKGYPMNGTLAPWATSFFGLYARNSEFGNKPPFHLPEIWLQKLDALTLKKPFNFVSTNDIIGGNSGSPVINKAGELVGLVFDGNIESLANRYVFHDDVPRTVSVHVAAITEALAKIYGGQRIVEELGVK